MNLKARIKTIVLSEARLFGWLLVVSFVSIVGMCIIASLFISAGRPDSAAVATIYGLALATVLIGGFVWKRMRRMEKDLEASLGKKKKNTEEVSQ